MRVLEMYKGYCFTQDGRYYPAVPLASEEAAWKYIDLQMKWHHEVRIVDSQDCIVLQAIRGKIVFPELSQEPPEPTHHPRIEKHFVNQVEPADPWAEAKRTHHERLFQDQQFRDMDYDGPDR